jgi:hypothetical protein
MATKTYDDHEGIQIQSSPCNHQGCTKRIRLEHTGDNGAGKNCKVFESKEEALTYIDAYQGLGLV